MVRKLGRPPAVVLVERWLDQHPGESFSPGFMARDPLLEGLHVSTVSGALHDLLDRRPGLVQVNRITWRTGAATGDGLITKPPPAERLRVVREHPAKLHRGSRLTVAGEANGVYIATDSANRLWAVVPAEIKVSS